MKKLVFALAVAALVAAFGANLHTSATHEAQWIPPVDLFAQL